MLPTTTLRTTLRLALAASVAAAVTALAGCTNDTTDMSGMDHGSSSRAAPATPSTPAGTSASGTPTPGPHNDADVMFAQMMIPHHQQAIQMSDMILAKDGLNSEIAELAQQIKDAQAPEIARMSGWLAGWADDPSPSMGMDHDMGGGMMSEAEMDALEKARGDEASRLFLTGMIKHHQGAITMAEAELADGQNPEAKQLAQDIITAQKAEITTMNQLLTQL
jgi:uncharacterized protein (DUF305 family)